MNGYTNCGTARRRDTTQQSKGMSTDWQDNLEESPGHYGEWEKKSHLS